MKRLSLLLCILWMGFIFYNSSQSGIDSNNKSFVIVNKVINNKVENVSDNKVNDTNVNIVNKSKELLKKINIIVRKSAHAFEFFILAILVMWVMYSYGVIGKDVIIYTLFVVLLYAISDEFHQLYVEGRTGKAEDIIIDFIGGIIGVSLYYPIYYFIKRNNKNN